MTNTSKIRLALILTLITFIYTGAAFPHCDSMEGPVVIASKQALETGNINYVLTWIKPEGEKEIKDLFSQVNKVRTLSPEAKQLADMYFFESVVRVHRMGEGVGYTGLIPAGVKPAEGIEAADLAIKNNSVGTVLSHLDEKYHHKVKELFADVQSKKNYKVDDIEAGRKYVESYVIFIHHVEGLFNGQEPKEENHHHSH